jgi:putative ABC transport system substrate-binding protein
MLKYFTLITALFLGLIPYSSNIAASEDRYQVHMVVWRGCEDACKGFKRYFEAQELPVDIIVTDVARDKSKLSEIRQQLINQEPDLVITWGTSVSVGIIGTIDEFGSATALGNIPALFMIVADPVRSRLIDSYASSGRPTVTGVRNRIPERTQLKWLFEYFHPSKLGVLNSPLELNSKYNTEALRKLQEQLNFELVENEYDIVDGDISPAQIYTKLAQLKHQGVQAIYVGSSSFNVKYQQLLSAAAVQLGLPLFSAYEKMVRNGNALMAIASSYTNVGVMAAGQAQMLLFDGVEAGNMPIKALDRFSIVVNMDVAQALSLYPSMQVLSLAEVVGTNVGKALGTPTNPALPAI